MTVMQNVEAMLGRMLKHVRSSNDKLSANTAGEGAAVMLEVASPAFKPGFPIPRQYSQDGANISPPIQWTGVPSSAKELLLVVEDPDAPRPQPVVHWIVYNIPPTASGLPENVLPGRQVSDPVGAMQGVNYMKELRYTGPKPPLGHGVHHYHFQLFAVDRKLELSAEPDKDELLKAMRGRVVAQGELVGTYERSAAGS